MGRERKGLVFFILFQDDIGKERMEERGYYLTQHR